jgi:hypothetical protein
VTKNACAKEAGQLKDASSEMLAVLEELEECSEYWSEYFVPIGIVDRIKAAIQCAKPEVS